jgi:pimeloyl-ACP methyl ester carboxylesterase
LNDELSITAVQKSFARRYFGVKDVQIACDVAGNPWAPSVILLHGGGQTRHSWAGAMSGLVARGYHVINLDTRGHGESEWAADGDYSLDTLVGDLKRVVDTLASRPALVGASLGGATALLLAAMQPQRVAALILVDVVPEINTVGANRIRNFMRSGLRGFATLDDVAEAVAIYNPLRPRPESSAGLFRNLRTGGDGRLYWHWDPLFLDAPQVAKPAMIAERLNWAAEQVRVPTLLIRGSQSDIITDAAVTEFRGHLPQLEVFNVSGASHMVVGDSNDAFNKGIFGFLRRHLRPDAAAPVSV